MLNFKNTILAYLVIMTILLSIHFFVSIPLFLFLITNIAFIILIVYGSAYIGSNFFITILTQGNNQKKCIAISFDDGPSPLYTNNILDILKNHNTPATFFCIGKNIEQNKNLLLKIDQDGHIIGNHTYNHPFHFGLLSKKKVKEELLSNSLLIEQIIHKKIKLFRPPFGVTNPNIAAAIKELNFIPIGWSARSLDTISKDPQKLLNKIKKQLEPGAVFLFHDTQFVITQVLSPFIEYCYNEGYQIIPISKLLNCNPYE